MRFYVNDLSLQGQFESSGAFIEALRSLLRLRHRWRYIADSLYCSREEFRKRPVHATQTVADALRATADRDFRNLALGWLDKFGPFLEDDKLEEQEDYFQYAGHVVTHQGLGEAARRTNALQPAMTFSFIGGFIDFNVDELLVQHGLDEAPIANIPVANVWTTDRLKVKALAAQPLATTWQELLDQCFSRYDLLAFSSSIARTLEAQTFYPTVRNAALELLAVLQEYMENRRADGTVTPHGHQLIEQYFRTGIPWFSDESSQNKVDFRNAMTFRDPENDSKFITCFWHGKIQTPQFRIHFEWPVPFGQKRLKVAYIGPKISKR